MNLCGSGKKYKHCHGSPRNESERVSREIAGYASLSHTSMTAM
jgi:SEC-C motif